MPPTSVLSDGTIRRLVAEGRVRIEPWDDAMVQPASVDLRLGGSFRVFHNHRIAAIDLADPPTNLTELVTLADGEPFVIHPGEFVLGRTQESVEMPDDLVARIEGKALALDTPVPTPDGWRTIGDLEPGDWVFAPGGQEIPVTAVSEVMLGRPCREVLLSDDTSVVTDVDHLWRVRTHDDSTAPAAHADDRPDRAERPPWQGLPVALGPMCAGSVRRARRCRSTRTCSARGSATERARPRSSPATTNPSCARSRWPATRCSARAARSHTGSEGRATPATATPGGTCRTTR